MNDPFPSFRSLAEVARSTAEVADNRSYLMVSPFKASPRAQFRRSGCAQLVSLGLTLSHGSRTLVRLASAAGASARNVAQIKECSSLVNRASECKAVAVGIAASQNDLWTLDCDLKAGIPDAVPVKTGAANQISASVRTNHHRDRKGRNIRVIRLERARPGAGDITGRLLRRFAGHGSGSWIAGRRASHHSHDRNHN
jgi:hypothetical protein